MPQYIDLYFLTNSRSVEVVENFLGRYLPDNEESAEDYPVPFFADQPDIIFDIVVELLAYLEFNRTYEYSIYWHGTKTNAVIKHAMAHYTDDGSMILGISVVGDNPMDGKYVQLFNEIRTYLNSNICCMTVEEPPPSNSEEFISFAKSRFVPAFA